MPGVGVFFGKPTEAQIRAEQARINAEDKLMAIHPLERTDLGFHCDAEGERAMVFITRLRDITATFTARSDRNLWATLIVGAVLIFKGIITPADIGSALTWLAAHL